MSNTIDDSLIQQFCSITGATPDRARFFVEASNGDISLAVGQYFENQGLNTNEGDDDDDHDFDLGQEAPVTRVPEPARPAPVAQPATKPTASAASSNKKMFTLSDLGGGEDEGNSDEEEGQAFYAGGSETSGQQILGPPRQRDPNKIIKDMFKKARDMGAEEVPELPSDDKPYQAIGGYRLGDGSGPSEKVAAAAGTSKRGGRQVRTLKLWKNGFNVDDGPLRSYEDRKNAEFLSAVHQGVTPDELVREAQGGEVHLEMQDHRDEELVAPKPAFVLYNTEGYKLGSPTPKVVSNTAPEAAKKNEENASKNVLKVDESQPKTQIRLTLSDGSKLNVTANHTHRISDLRSYLVAARPEYATHRFAFETTFPKKTIQDESKSLKEENVLNSVLVVKLS